LFSRVSKYAGNENRLTESLATVLERNPELALSLARDWTSRQRFTPREVPASGETDLVLPEASPLFLTVRTQAQAQARRAIDLELRFGAAPHQSAGDAVIWIEVKLDADPHESQIANYLRDIELVPAASSSVVLLAPQRALPWDSPLVPSHVPQRSWQHVAAVAQRAAEADRSTDSSVVNEFHRYLKELSLVEPPVIRPEHLFALEIADEAESALQAALARASAAIARDWQPRSEFKRTAYRDEPEFSWNYYESWSLDNVEGEAWLDWNAVSDTSDPLANGRSLFFLSGLCANSERDLLAAMGDSGREAALEQGVHIDGLFVRFIRLVDSSGYHRFAQAARPAEVLVGSTLDEQANNLARWVVAGFRALTT
jgi:hypothetical protein